MGVVLGSAAFSRPCVVCGRLLASVGRICAERSVTKRPQLNGIMCRMMTSLVERRGLWQRETSGLFGGQEGASLQD